MSDLISRQAALDALNEYFVRIGKLKRRGLNKGEKAISLDVIGAINSLPPAQPGQRNARVFQGIIVEYPTISTYPEYEGKPYFSIKYTENGQGFIGYGTYKPEVLSEYLKEYFMPSVQPECKDAVSRWGVINAIENGKPYQQDADDIAEMVQNMPPVTPKQPGWTYIEEALPETIINKHTNDYQEYNCLCDFGDNGFDVRTYKFGNGHFWNGGGIVDKYVTAWQPLPEIPDALKPKPWEGGRGMTDELKKCPFCGGEAAVMYAVTDDGTKTISVVCQKCSIGIFRARTSENDWNAWEKPEKAIAAWNRREGEQDGPV